MFGELARRITESRLPALAKAGATGITFGRK